MDIWHSMQAYRDKTHTSWEVITLRESFSWSFPDSFLSTSRYHKQSVTFFKTPWPSACEKCSLEQDHQLADPLKSYCGALSFYLSLTGIWCRCFLIHQNFESALYWKWRWYFYFFAKHHKINEFDHFKDRL